MTACQASSPLVNWIYDLVMVWSPPSENHHMAFRHQWTCFKCHIFRVQDHNCWQCSLVTEETLSLRLLLSPYMLDARQAVKGPFVC